MMKEINSTKALQEAIIETLNELYPNGEIQIVRNMWNGTSCIAHVVAENSIKSITPWVKGIKPLYYFVCGMKEMKEQTNK